MAKIHDPKCPVLVKQPNVTPYCQCDLIASVRADEQHKAEQRFNDWFARYADTYESIGYEHCRKDAIEAVRTADPSERLWNEAPSMCPDCGTRALPVWREILNEVSITAISDMKERQET